MVPFCKTHFTHELSKFSNTTVSFVNTCTVGIIKSVMGAKIYKAPWCQNSLEEHLIPLCRMEEGGGGGLCSSPTSHKATVSARRQYSSYPKISFCYFFNLKALHFMNNKITIMHRIIYYQNYTHLVAKSIFSRNSNKQFKPSNSINLCTNLQEKTLITIHYSP